jgi:hypothetical protein
LAGEGEAQQDVWGKDGMDNLGRSMVSGQGYDMGSGDISNRIELRGTFCIDEAARFVFEIRRPIFGRRAPRRLVPDPA